MEVDDTEKLQKNSSRRPTQSTVVDTALVQSIECLCSRAI